MKFKKGDTVRVVSGKDKNKEGTISKVLPKENKVIVEGINVAKRHTKATQTRQKAEILEKPMPIDASNVMLVSKGKTTRVSFRIKADGTKVRVATKTGEEV
ncbi:MAG: ribosomal protein [Actinomycetota bacterium]|jgi:large subunit ribosomal protein L24